MYRRRLDRAKSNCTSAPQIKRAVWSFGMSAAERAVYLGPHVFAQSVFSLLGGWRLQNGTTATRTITTMQWTSRSGRPNCRFIEKLDLELRGKKRVQDQHASGHGLTRTFVCTNEWFGAWVCGKTCPSRFVGETSIFHLTERNNRLPAIGARDVRPAERTTQN